MGRKNAFLTKMQQQHKREAQTAIILTEKWIRQAACDALVLLLGYGEIMGKTKWGQKKNYRAVMEWTELFLWILRGLEMHPDSDAIREQVDKLLKPKVPEELYREWGVRYPGMLGETMEEEVQRMRPKWLRDGELAADPVTSKLMRGVGRDG